MIPDRPVPSTPETNAALRGRLEELLGEYDRVRGNLAEVQRTMRSARGDAASGDGSVRVTVGPRGELQDLKLDPRAYRRLSPSELASEILVLAGRAARDVQEQVAEVMAPFLPAGVSYEEVASGEADPSGWLPRLPLAPEEFDQWWAGIRNQPAGGPGGRDANEPA